MANLLGGLRPLVALDLVFCRDSGHFTFGNSRAAAATALASGTAIPWCLPHF